jgi:hypothetical protein
MFFIKLYYYQSKAIGNGFAEKKTGKDRHRESKMPEQEIFIQADLETATIVLKENMKEKLSANTESTPPLKAQRF